MFTCGIKLLQVLSISVGRGSGSIHDKHNTSH